MILQRVNLSFDPNIPSFTIECEELQTELYTPLLRVIPSINQTMLSDLIKEIQNNVYHIADKANMVSYFERLINVIDKTGRYVETFEIGHKGPMIMHDPILFLRKRNLGYAGFIDSIIEDIENSNDIVFPDFLENMVGNYRIGSPVENSEENWNENGIDEKVLLTLPANNEQLRTIKHLDNYGAVLVQGPPGTGKTHTIANLIGHLLSEGKSVLVTSHTEKALTVLKDKVFKELRNLCISLLSSSSQRKEMDTALFEIAEKSTSIDLRTTKQEIERLEQGRKDLVETYRQKQQELIHIRSLDYKDIVLSNETISPIEAAKFINKGQGKYDYIPGNSIDDTAMLPLSIDELTYLYKSNDMISSDQEAIISKGLPGIEEILSCKDFADKITTLLELESTLKDWVPKLHFTANTREDTILELITRAENLEQELSCMVDYQLNLMGRAIKDRFYGDFWGEILEEFNDLMEGFSSYRRLLFDNDYNIPRELINNDTINILEEIIATGKEVPVGLITCLTRPKWKRVKDSIRKDNKPIEKQGDFSDAKLIISHESRLSGLISKTNKLFQEISYPLELGHEDVESKVEDILERVRGAVSWHDEKWVPFVSAVRESILDQISFDITYLHSKNSHIDDMKDCLSEVFLKDLKLHYSSILLNKIRDELNAYKGHF